VILALEPPLGEQPVRDALVDTVEAIVRHQGRGKWGELHTGVSGIYPARSPPRETIARGLRARGPG
jgi:hypothetical protein